MGKTTNGLERLMNSFKVYDEFDEKVYHDAHLLLDIYSDVLWGMNNSYTNIVRECKEIYGNSSIMVLDVITEFGSDLKAKLLHEQLEDTEASKVIIEIINAAMFKLVTYPNKGERYYEILKTTYFSEKKYSENEILDILKLSRSTYFRQRKKAISLFGVILWGYVLPEFISNNSVGQ
ncbi:hypothetical protein ACR6HW_16800 [Fusibacter sp. JL298sf-3]|jgi:hypothetical protein